MDEQTRERVREQAEIDALFNAVKHGEAAQVGAIMGPLLGETPEFRPHADEIPAVIGPVVEQVNSLEPSERRDRLADLAPDRLAALEAESESDNQQLSDLPGADAVDEVRMRVAPNPNGPWHIGHARMAAVVGTYKQLYDGAFLCRFDDTDPDTKRPDLAAYDAILDAIGYLGFEPDAVLRASDRLETYYEYARRLIDRGGAYTCSCAAETFSELKNAGEPCAHRDKPPAQIHEEFDRMVAGGYKEGEMVLRVRTDIEHKNPALRDWVAFRIVDRPHPRDAAADYRCWPMLDFQSGIDDYLTDVTHIIRGIDLQDSAKRQGFVYEYFGWEYPEVVHWGRVSVDEYELSLSTSTLSEKIRAGELDGWDDPRAPTVASLRQRGIQGDALVAAMTELGVSASNVSLSMSSVYAANRKLIDDAADRLFLVRGEPAEFPVRGGPDAGTPPVHPDHDARGRRTLPVEGEVAIEHTDCPEEGERVWLKGYGPVRRVDGAFEHTDDDLSVTDDGVDIVHWVPAETGVSLRLRTPEGDVTGVAESRVTQYAPDDIVQFERIGFARIDSTAPPVAYFAHR